MTIGHGAGGRFVAAVAAAWLGVAVSVADNVRPDTPAKAGNHPQPTPASPRQEPTAGARRASPQSFAPEVEIQKEDYAAARARFQTKLTRRGPSPQPAEPVKRPAGVSEIEYRSGDLRLKAWLNRPQGSGERPAVLFLHGGFAFGTEDWDASQTFRDAGFVVLTPLLRGENGQPGAYSFFYDEVDDVLAAADWLRSQPYVDADRVFIAGPSAGGTLALLAAMASKSFRAAASYSASPDQVLLCKHAKHAARDVPVDISDRQELTMRSPLAFAASLKCPTRVYFGSQEPHFRETSRKLAGVAKEHGIDAEVVQVPGDHGSSVAPAVRQSLAFFQAR